MGNFELEDDEDAGFLAHAKATFDRHFKYIATPIHWLALFLHPLCRKLAVSETAHGHNLEFMWRWTEHKACQLAADLKVYYYCKAPFSGGSKDAKGWWEDVPAGKHEGIRSLGIILASIVPHSADVERLFSDLGQTQTPHRKGMTVDHMEKYGKIRARLTYELHEWQTAISGISRRQHNHMHTRPTGGIDGDLAKDLENPITWILPLREDNTEQLDDEDIVEKAFQDPQKTVKEEGPITSETSGSVVGGEIVNFEELACIDNGGANLRYWDVAETDAPAEAQHTLSAQGRVNEEYINGKGKKRKTEISGTAALEKSEGRNPGRCTSIRIASRIVVEAPLEAIPQRFSRRF
ncbi:hypothetical protein DFH08DRAFT_940241 [Mycena albidolilacea]|uniref:HAT C-terminal dimerisation domain-containing protein n=1 Tax=Mycena albidolilacea TaxID=1033008 RepID=A0AAD7EL94_9AGAR|nr:hypothetical protein DFH08DRAFT_940241 [Mycena albidolilacea]